MNSQEAVEVVRKIFTPKRLSYIDELVFRHSWERKLYREIAQETGYEQGYLKDIGSRLWLDLSQKLECEVTNPGVTESDRNLCPD